MSTHVHGRSAKNAAKKAAKNPSSAAKPRNRDVEPSLSLHHDGQVSNLQELHLDRGISTVFCTVSTVGTCLLHTKNVSHSDEELNLRQLQVHVRVELLEQLHVHRDVDHQNLHGFRHSLHPACTSLTRTTGMSIPLLELVAA